ncbi:MAG TPA: iron-containing alcohol dehydrogenase [Solirubrobacterales bacterium]|nr:iron-containing alcohol dehydrogenase [Solirubrobacterales bacterium]
MTSDFTWRDAGRTVVFRRGAVGEAPGLLRDHGFERFTLLSTERALAAAGDQGAKALVGAGDEGTGALAGAGEGGAGGPEPADAAGLVGAALRVHTVAPGQVPGLAAAALGALGDEPLVALGGGRVIDTAKAVAAVTGARVAAIPTTLSGAEMTAIHRLPAGAEQRVGTMVRPSLVLADPEAMTGQDESRLRASAMNALGHGADTLYLPLSNPVSEMTALRGAELIGRSLDQGREGRDRAALALGSLLCGYAIDSAGLGLHHVVCQTLARICGTPHAETNAAVLPRSIAFLAERAPEPYERLAVALGTNRGELSARIEELGRPGRLGALGGDESKLDEAISAMLERPELERVPRPPDEAALRDLVQRAW